MIYDGPHFVTVIRMIMGQKLLAISLLFALPGCASNFTGWKRPKLPSACPIHFSRIYQNDADGSIHVVVSNSGGSAMTLTLNTHITTRVLGKTTFTQIDVPPRASSDIVVIADSRATTSDEIALSVDRCGVTKL